jgi:molecular chaperone DnaK (HSP70)
MTKPRYLIGIDLGTTNSVLAYLDAGASGYQPQVLPVLQWDSPVSSVARQTLPSFNYLTTSIDRQSGFRAGSAEFPVPPGDWVPGIYARNRMADTPSRVIHSAKSWLCHGGIDRTASQGSALASRGEQRLSGLSQGGVEPGARGPGARSAVREPGSCANRAGLLR